METVVAVERWWRRRPPRARLALCYFPLIASLLLVGHLPTLIAGVLCVGSLWLAAQAVTTLFHDDFDQNQVDMVTLVGALAGVVGLVPSGNLFAAIAFGFLVAIWSRVAACKTLRQREQQLPPPPPR